MEQPQNVLEHLCGAPSILVIHSKQRRGGRQENGLVIMALNQSMKRASNLESRGRLGRDGLSGRKVRKLEAQT